MEIVTQEDRDENLKKFYDMVLTARNDIVTFLRELEPVQIIGYNKKDEDVSLTIRVKDKGDYNLILQKIDYSDIPNLINKTLKIDNDENDRNC